MTAAKLIEYRIIQQLQQRREVHSVRAVCPTQDEISSGVHTGVQVWADRLIAVLALTVGLLLIGSYFEDLLWVALGAATVCSLRD